MHKHLSLKLEQDLCQRFPVLCQVILSTGEGLSPPQLH